MQKVRRTGELHVGYLVFSPCINSDPRSKDLPGYFVDMVQHIAENLKVKVIFHETTLKDFAAGLNTNQFDISICPTYRTISRASAVAFTRPIFYMGNGAVVRKQDADKLTRKTNLNDQTFRIAVLQGQAMHEYARIYLPKAQLSVLSSGDLTAPLLEVSAGRADVGFCNYLDTERYCAAHSEVLNIFKDAPIEVIPLAWAVRSGDMEWLNFIDTCIDYMDSTGRIARWEEKYGIPMLHEKVSFELRGKQ
jgi:polar amino acid transport system substrate-binding protein